MFETVREGWIKAGWVLVPLMLASLAGWYIVFRKLLALYALDWGSRPEWRRRLAQGRHAAFLDSMGDRDKRSVAGEALYRVWTARRGGRAAMEAGLDEVMKFRVPELERSLSTLAILASAAPLMGLLGTVSGIVRTFKVISAFGTGNQALMSDSIAESLMATQNGLLVAFPLLLMHVWLASKAEGIEKAALAEARTLINRCATAERPGGGIARPVPSLSPAGAPA